MRTLTFAAAAVALSVLAGCGQKKAEWKEFSSPEGKFAVLMPGATKTETRTQGPLTIKAFVVDMKNRAYLASFADLPPGTVFDLSAAVQGMAASYQGKVLSESAFTVEGQQGKAFEMEIKQPKGFATGRVVVVNNRLYQTLVLGSDTRGSDPDVRKFLDSFRVTK